MKRKGVFYYKPATKKTTTQGAQRVYASPKTSIITRAPAYQRSSRREEAKAVDILPTTPLLFNNGGVFTCLNAPVNGSGYNNRVGTKIRMKSVYVTGEIVKTLSNSSAVAEDYGRFILFLDRQPNAAFPAVADLLSSVSVAGAVSSTATDQINLQNRDRFVILRDTRIILPGVGINGIAPALVDQYPDFNCNESKYNMAMFVPLKDTEAHFNLVAGGIASVTSGALNVLTFCNNAAGGNAAWQFVGSIRTKYYDV